MKKIIALLLLLVMACGMMVSCGDEVEPPTGFQNASVGSAPFYLYVPNTWTSNASSGISSAYCSTESRVLVSAFAKENEEGILLEQYTGQTLESFLRTLEDFELTTKMEDAVLGSYAAYRFGYTATSGDKSMEFLTYVSEYVDGFAVLTYSAEQTAFETYAADFAEIVAKFTFKVKNENEIPQKNHNSSNHETVDGWQLASNLKYEYSFYVPKSWTVDKSMEFPYAYYSAERGDNSNVTLMSYVLDTPMTAKQYWEETQENMMYECTVISADENAILGGLSACAVEYATGHTGMRYLVKQVFCSTSNMVYVFTYTSADPYYDVHLNSVNEMIKMFAFN